MSKQFWVNHWRRGRVQMSLLAVIVPLTVILLGINFWYVKHANAQTQEQAAISVETYRQVQKLRQDMALTNEDLAALGSTREQAERVLQTLLDWCENHDEDIKAQQADERVARHALRQLQRQINVGPRDERVIQQHPTLQAQLLAAREQRRQLVEAASSTIESQFDTTQRRMWTTAKQNLGGASRLRYVSALTEVQQKQLTMLSRQTAGGMATDSLSNSGILTLTQQDESELALSNQHLHMTDVLAAEMAVLPVPDELKEDDPGLLDNTTSLQDTGNLE